MAGQEWPFAGTGRLEIALKCNYWWQPLFLFCAPRVKIDGEEHIRKWRTETFDLSVGEHNVQIYFSYLGGKRTGLAETTVIIRHDVPVRLTYMPPSTVFQRGRLTTG